MVLYSMDEYKVCCFSTWKHGGSITIFWLMLPQGYLYVLLVVKRNNVFQILIFSSVEHVILRNDMAWRNHTLRYSKNIIRSFYSITRINVQTLCIVTHIHYSNDFILFYFKSSLLYSFLWKRRDLIWRTISKYLDEISLIVKFHLMHIP